MSCLNVSRGSYEPSPEYLFVLGRREDLAKKKLLPMKEGKMSKCSMPYLSVEKKAKGDPSLLLNSIR